MRDSTSQCVEGEFDEVEKCCVAALVAEAVYDEIPEVGPRTAVIFVDFTLQVEVLAAIHSLGQQSLNATARYACMKALDGFDVVAFWRWDVSVDAIPPVDFILIGLCNLDQANLLGDAALVLLTDGDPKDLTINEGNLFIALPRNALRQTGGPLSHRPADPRVAAHREVKLRADGQVLWSSGT